MKMLNSGSHYTSKLVGTVLAIAWFACTLLAQNGSPPSVSSVFASQQPGTKLVNISYAISDPDSTNVNVYIKVSKDSGATWTVPAVTFTGDYGPNVAVSASVAKKFVVWNAGADWDGHFTTTCRVRVIANDAGMLMIPGGTYARGNSLVGAPKGDLDITDAPPSSVTVSGFLMDAAPVTGGQWSLVVEGFAQANGYSFDSSGPARSGSYPMLNLNWFDAIKWCNARSEMEGAAPVYFTDPGFTTVYRSGHAAPYIKPGANGYRRPTEAEWEIAARGGLVGMRFPWGSTISQSQANYYSCNDTNKCISLA